MRKVWISRFCLIFIKQERNVLNCCNSIKFAHSCCPDSDDDMKCVQSVPSDDSSLCETTSTKYRWLFFAIFKTFNDFNSSLTTCSSIMVMFNTAAEKMTIWDASKCSKWCNFTWQDKCSTKYRHFFLAFSFCFLHKF